MYEGFALFLRPLLFLFLVYLLNNNRQWTEDAKGELNVLTQNSIFSHVSKIKRCTIQDYYVMKIGNRLFSPTGYTSQSSQV